MSEFRAGRPATLAYLLCQTLVTLALIGVALVLRDQAQLLLGAIVVHWLREGAYMSQTARDPGGFADPMRDRRVPAQRTSSDVPLRERLDALERDQ